MQPSSAKTETDVLLKRISDLELQNEQLKLENNHLHRNLPLAYQSLDGDGCILDVNQTWLNMLGYEREEVIGRPFSDFMHKDSVDTFKENFPKFKLAGTVCDVEFNLRKSDGSLFTIILDGRIVRVKENEFLRTACFIKDVTYQKALNERYQRANSIMQFVMDAMSSFVFWKNVDGIYLGCNKNFAEASGVESPEQIIGKTDYDLAWEKEQADWFNHFDQQVIKDNKPSYDIIKSQRFANGKQAWINSNKAPLHNDQGQVIGVVGYYDDITERLEAEHKLKESEERFRLLAENSLIGIYLAQGDRFHYINQTFATMFGYETEEVLNDLSLADIVYPDDLALVSENIQRRLEGVETTSHYTFRGMKKDGTIISVEVHGAGINYQGKPGIIGSLLDNTEKEQTQEQLRQAQKLEAIGRLSSGITHDINNLLTPILGLSEILALNPDLPENESRMLDQMTNAACRARDLIGQLLAFSRKQVLKVEPFDLNQTLDEYSPLIQRTLREDIHMTMEKSDDLKPVLADQGQIEQVLMNLVVNAADAMPAGGRLTIETTMVALDESHMPTPSDIEPGDYAMLRVQDTGLGMDTETISRIFEPFYTTKGDEGTGLGLATVYGIVKQHKGTIWVQSEPEQGTTFKVLLPVTNQALHIGQQHDPQSQLQGTETILVVEDDDLVRNTVCAILEQGHYTVVATDSGTNALELVNKGYTPDLLLTDVVMPDMNGKIVHRRIKEQIPSIKVLYMSGYTDDIIVQQDTLEEGVDFIQKPFGARAVLGKIRTICDS